MKVKVSEQFFKVIDHLYRPDIDVCATDDSAIHPHFIAENQSLNTPWFMHGSVAWCNPSPEGKTQLFIEKANVEGLNGLTVILLLRSEEVAASNTLSIPDREYRWVNHIINFRCANKYGVDHIIRFKPADAPFYDAAEILNGDMELWVFTPWSVRMHCYAALKPYIYEMNWQGLLADIEAMEAKTA